MKTETINKLDEIVGKTFFYKNKNITISNYKIVGSTNVVVFCPQPINLLFSEVESFLDNLLEPSVKEITETQISVPKKEMVTFEPTKENQKIKETLLETLDKIKTDPNYIPQANAICEVVSQMVSLQKNEIQMIAIINKFKN